MEADLEKRIDIPVRVSRAGPEPVRAGRFARLRPRRFSTILGLFLVGTVLLAGLFARVIAPAGPWTSVAAPFQPPSLAHPFGTDDLGRDLLSGVVHGARTSLVVGLTVASLSTLAGVLLGAVSGFVGGLVDDALMRFTEFFQTIPRFFLALLAVALFEPGLATITLILVLTSWSTTARLLRAQVLSVREREYVVASKALGASGVYQLWAHILPNSIAPVIVHSMLMVGQVMLIEASLAYLGLADPNNISWGYLLNNAQAFLRTAWWMPFFPGLALTLAVLGFNFLGDGLHQRISRNN
jgi:peptide/nickel transport system permease protein